MSELRDFLYRDMEAGFDECFQDWVNRSFLPAMPEPDAAFMFRDMAGSLSPIPCGESAWIDPDGADWVTPDGDSWEAIQ